MTLVSAANESDVIPGQAHVLAILDKTGDSKIIWDPSNQPEVDAAKEQFTKLVDKGYQAYKVDAKGGKGEKITKFDPAAEKIILAPALVGG